MSQEVLSLIQIALLFAIWSRLGQIAARTRERFPTKKEADFDWSQNDPAGHWEAHKDE